MRITISKEDYLKAIAESQAEGDTVIAATLARWLGVSAPAVMALRRLIRDGLIRVNNHGHVILTVSGLKIADRLRTRHDLIERMLMEVFGMEWYKVHEEAERLEHAVSEDFERCLVRVLGNGKPCPHGDLRGRENPKARRRLGWMPLDEIESGRKITITWLFERDRGLLEYIHKLGLRPGTCFAVESRNCDETLTLAIAGKKVQLGRAAAARIWVKTADNSGETKRGRAQTRISI